ncbi:MAG TPA: magnesium transporter [Longimicrobiales bacterium]|nr:magnesium transporter [Longimicrobiales bacterium]
MAERTSIDIDELREVWWVLAVEERLEGFRLLDGEEAEEFFSDLTPRDQAELLLAVQPRERRILLRALAPDDAVDLLQELDDDERRAMLELLDNATRREVSVLMAYEEDEAGGLMSSRFARVRPDMTVDQAVSYLRKQAVGGVELETIYYSYVLEPDHRLVGIVSFRELFASPGARLVRDVMLTEFVAVPEAMDQEEVARIFAEYDVLALPVVDDDGRMKGIVTVDDIVDVVEEEATEDAHKFGGLAALDLPYLRTDFLAIVKKRAGWLILLFLGGMLTANALAQFEDSIALLPFLTLFIPLIIASGGNSGSQASTLVIRAMAMDEVRLRDWWRVARRELATGLALGTVLGAIGFFRVVLFPGETAAYGPNAVPLFGVTIAVSLLGVVLFGTLVGSMLPFVLRKAGLDPASASAPLVATLVDVSGLIIYFVTAGVMLREILRGMGGG